MEGEDGVLSPGEVGCLLPPLSTPNLVLELSQWEPEISCLHRVALGVTWSQASCAHGRGPAGSTPFTRCSLGTQPAEKEGCCSHPAPEPSLRAQKCCALVTQVGTRDTRTS